MRALRTAVADWAVTRQVPERTKSFRARPAAGGKERVPGVGEGWCGGGGGGGRARGRGDARPSLCVLGAEVGLRRGLLRGGQNRAALRHAAEAGGPRLGQQGPACTAGPP